MKRTDAKFSFTRDSIGWGFERNGAYVAFPPGQPRITYNPYLCEDLNSNILQNPGCDRRASGILIEEARTNFLKQSFVALESWTSKRVAVSASSSTTPSKNKATRLTLDANTSTGSISQRFQLPEASIISVSLYANDMHPALAYDVMTGEPASPNQPALFRIRLRSYAPSGVLQDSWTTGVIDIRHQYFDPGTFRPTVADPRDLYGGVQPLDGSWVHAWTRTPVTVSAGYLELEIVVEPSKSGDRTLDLWGIQAEDGEFPTSYIPTDSQSARRDADQLIVRPNSNSTEFGWYNPSQGNFLIDGMRNYDFPRMFSYFLEKRGSGQRQVIGVKGGFLQIAQRNGENFVHHLPEEYHPGDFFRLSAGYSLPITSGGSSLSSLMINGGERFAVENSEKLDTTASVSIGQSSLTIGHIDSTKYARHLNGTIAKIAYFARHLQEDDQRKLTNLGTIEDIKSSIGSPNPALSEECDQQLSLGLTKTKWISRNGQQENHILSRRFIENIVLARGPSDERGDHTVCRFKTERNADPVRTGWTTGSMASQTEQRYGYFEAEYIVSGLPERGWLNNAFWLMRMVNTGERAKKSNINFEIDINEGKVPNKVYTNFHLHNHFKNLAGLSFHPFATSLWRAPRSGESSQQYERFALLWNVQELIWLRNGLIFRRMPNFSAHNYARVYFSTAILKAGPEIPATLNGMNVDLNYIRVKTLKSTRERPFSFLSETLTPPKTQARVTTPSLLR